MKRISNNELEKKFDSGEDISDYVDWNHAKKLNIKQKRVNVDLPIWMVHQLDKESKKIGITRQSIIKVWLSERMDQLSSS